MASIIPEVLNHFNIYNGANALVGVSGEVELPELEAITDTCLLYTSDAADE